MRSRGVRVYVEPGGGGETSVAVGCGREDIWPLDRSSFVPSGCLCVDDSGAAKDRADRTKMRPKWTGPERTGPLVSSDFRIQNQKPVIPSYLPSFFFPPFWAFKFDFLLENLILVTIQTNPENRRNLFSTVVGTMRFPVARNSLVIFHLME